MREADIMLRLAETKAVGLNQTKKQILNGNAQTVFIAGDADSVFAGQLIRLCEDKNVTVDRSFSMSELGKACGIDVPCAVCALTINN